MGGACGINGWGVWYKGVGRIVERGSAYSIKGCCVWYKGVGRMV